MRPSRTQLYLIGFWILLALGLAIIRQEVSPGLAIFLSTLWWSVGLAFVLLLLVDFINNLGSGKISLTREMPASFSQGSANLISLRIENPLDRAVEMLVFDRCPSQVKVDAFPCSFLIKPKNYTEVRYQVQPVVRGDATFGLTELRVMSRWKLWEYYLVRGKPDAVKIYPNFANIRTLLMLEHDQQANQLGIHVQQRRGEGIDFHQLREYRKGDSLSKIDWKATSRHVKLISREYTDERDQDIIFLLDCGRRMRTFDGELSHFDHALNALLLTSYIALKQGDAVGMLSFAGDTRWISPVKGPAAINYLLNSVYDLHSTTKTSDLIQAVEQMMLHHRKRALVVIVSNVREEDYHDLLTATRTLSKQHLVMVASLREQFLDDAVAKPVKNFKDALRYSGVVQFIDQRKRVLDTLVDRGVVMVDALAQNIHSELANQYLNLKRSGRI